MLSPHRAQNNFFGFYGLFFWVFSATFAMWVLLVESLGLMGIWDMVEDSISRQAVRQLGRQAHLEIMACIICII